MDLAGLILTLAEFKSKWEGVKGAISKDDFSRAFQRVLDQLKHLLELAVTLWKKFENAPSRTVAQTA
jgi:hypothetical protein